MKIFLSIICIHLTIIASGQRSASERYHDWEIKEWRNDSLSRLLAEKFIYNKLGKLYAQKHLEYYANFRGDHRAVLFKVKGSQFKHKILPIIFDTSAIDTKLSKVEKKEILKCKKQNCNSYLWIDSSEAVRLAKTSTNFFNRPYYIDFVFMNGRKSEPTWNVEVYLSGSRRGGQAHGKSISVDAITEKVDSGGIFTVEP